MVHEIEPLATIRAALPPWLVERLRHEDHPAILEVTLRAWLCETYPQPDPQQLHGLVLDIERLGGGFERARPFLDEHRGPARERLRAAQRAYTRNRCLETCLVMVVAERDWIYADRDSMLEWLEVCND
jgi:hypothetical protein